MVIVLAALYSIYRSQREQSQQQEAATESNNNNSNDDTTNSTSTRNNSITDQLQRTGSALYESTVLRCTTVPGEQNNNDNESGAMTAAAAAAAHNNIDSSSSSRITSNDHTTTNETEDTTNETEVIRPPDAVQQEWINACFGADFAAEGKKTQDDDSTASRTTTTGTGIAGKYQVLTVRIPPSSSSSTASSSSVAVASTTTSPAAVAAADTTSSCDHPSQSSPMLDPSSNSCTSTKIGITISRFAVGVHVQSVDATSEAALAGVLPHSILVSINDMPVLTEPSKSLLERLWQYEGYFTAGSSSTTSDYNKRFNMNNNHEEDDDENDDIVLQKRHRALSSTSAAYPQYPTNTTKMLTHQQQRHSDGQVREPVVLKFVHQGRIYSVLLLSNPTWGIQWAPATQSLPLVKRCWGIAAKCGVSKGSIVVSVNNGQQSFRTMDHIQTAMQIRTIYNTGTEPLQITTVLPPATGRPGHYERQRLLSSGGDNSNTIQKHALVAPSVPPPHRRRPRRPLPSTGGLRQEEPDDPKQQQLYDGVEVKFLPLGYAIGSLCAFDSSSLLFSSNHDTATRDATKVEDLAEQVASGRIAAPLPKNATPRRMALPPPQPKYAACPSLPLDQLWEAWDPLQSLVYCLRFQRCLMEDTDFIQHLKLHTTTSKQRRPSSMQILTELLSGTMGADLATAFLLQCISLICAPGQCSDGMIHTSTTLTTDPTASSAAAAAAAHEAQMKQNANDLTSLLLKLSRKNESFCQRLYFLLRSYISTFETSRPPQQQPQNDDSRNLMALLNCLELLRFAEKELGGRSNNSSILSSSSSKSAQSPRKSTTAGDMLYRSDLIGDMESSSIRCLVQSPVPSPIPVSPDSPSEDGGLNHDMDSPRKKRVLPFLKKSPRRKSPHRNAHARRPSNDAKRQPSPVLATDTSSMSLEQCPSTMYENMSDFLTELDKICTNIERTFQKSFRQKIADWAMQPWSAGKDATLSAVTVEMRNSLESASLRQMLLVNPVESSELLSSLDYNECYILPSAHFPILLTFNVSERRCSDSIVGEERLYRTRVELVALHGTSTSSSSSHEAFSVQGSFAGSTSESGKSSISAMDPTTARHIWRDRGLLLLESRSSWGAPQTLSLRLSGHGSNLTTSDVGFCWLDLSEQWKRGDALQSRSTKRMMVDVYPTHLLSSRFDERGDLTMDATKSIQCIQLEVEITTESVEFDDDISIDGKVNPLSRKRMLLYKHDDDLRQEAFAIQFIRTCSDILKASGLDMKLLTFQCIPVGTKRGFVEWVPGSVTLSEICDPGSSIISGKASGDLGHTESSSPNAGKPGMSKYGSLRRLSGQQNEAFRLLTLGRKAENRGSIANDPIQDYLRSVAFDPRAPYLIRHDVMDTYIKSCAGYSVITYILGVGDRHLDNLLLHQSGSFFHCDFSFILGSDPKTYLPMRITEDMVYGMGGRDSDNYARFLTLIAAAFVALRRPENVRILLSMVRLMKASCLPDISENQSIERAIMGVRDRLRLDLSEPQAITFMEDLVEASLSNKMWIAVDAIHKLGKNF